MGGLISTQEFRVCVVGLDQAGKCTIIAKVESLANWINLNKQTVTMAKINAIKKPYKKFGHVSKKILYNYEGAESDIIWNFLVMGGGKTQSGRHRANFYKNMAALIFVVDASDKVSIDTKRETMGALLTQYDAKKEFQQYLMAIDKAYRKQIGKDENDQKVISDAPILVFANKNDKDSTMGHVEIEERLGLHELGTKRKWRVEEKSKLNCFFQNNYEPVEKK